MLTRGHQRLACYLCLSSSATTGFPITTKTQTTKAKRFMSNDNDAILKVGLCQFPVTEKKETNLSTCANYIERAANNGVQMVVLPEIWNSPYATAAFPEYAEDLRNSPSSELLKRMAIEHSLWIVGGSIPEVDDSKKIYNTCQVFSPQGEVVAKHRKAHLFDIDVPGGIRFFESETLTAGSSVTDFNTPWGRIGLGICYDIRFPEYALALRARDCKILIYPGAFNLTTGPAHWELLQRARAVDTQCYVLTASPARTVNTSDLKYPHYAAWGHSTAVAPWGDIVATRDETEGIVFADLDLNKVKEMRQAIPVEQQKRVDLYHLTTDRP